MIHKARFTLNFVTEGASLRELYEANKELFRNMDTVGEIDLDQWWKKEPFIDDRHEAGEWEIILDTETNQSKEGYIVPPVSLVAEALIQHYRKIGWKLYEKAYIETNTKDSNESKILFGICCGFNEFKLSRNNRDDKDNFIALARKIK